MNDPNSFEGLTPGAITVVGVILSVGIAMIGMLAAFMVRQNRANSDQITLLNKIITQTKVLETRVDSHEVRITRIEDHFIAGPSENTD